MKAILNLTQHKATSAQIKAGVVDCPKIGLDQVLRHLNFQHIPTEEDMFDRAIKIKEIVKDLGYDTVMIGGAPFFMSTLERTLKMSGIKVLYAFSERVSHERMVNGQVEKTTTFEHLGFYEAV